jgi:hypothetical protein
MQETYKLYYGAGTWEAVTSYASDFTPKIELSIMEQIDLAQFYKENNLTITFKETVKQIASKQFDGDNTTLNLIIEEIDTASIQQNDGNILQSDE